MTKITIENIALAEAAVFAFFFLCEHLFPRRNCRSDEGFHSVFLAVQLWAGFLAKVTLLVWTKSTWQGVCPCNMLNNWQQAAIFYLVYSFGNYWFHRVKHSSPVLWRYVHRFHHTPTHMNTLVTTFKHPFEIIVNYGFLLVTGKFLLGVSPEAGALCLAIEATLEFFHHSNIHWPKSLACVGYVIQTPPMHVVHHKRGYHTNNFAPAVWDTVFGTVEVPDVEPAKVGTANRHNFTALLRISKPK